jgi:ATP-dependent Lhr-like helicase
MADDPKPPSLLPARFADWFATRGWNLRPHQADLIDAARRGQGGLVIAPTGGGKTLAGFLPSLIELAETPPRVHPAAREETPVRPNPARTTGGRLRSRCLRT